MCKIALVPAYEPESVLFDLANELKRNRFEIVVIDDGSGQKYSNLFQALKIQGTVISYAENHGKGYALKTGLSYIYHHFSDGIVVTLDADGQHLVSDAIRLCNAFEHSDAELFIGSRRLSKSDPLRSRFGNKVTESIYQILTGVNVHDTQSGLRAFRTDLIPMLLRIPGERYEYEMNVLLNFAKKGLSMEEIPIETIYFDKKNSVSHFNTLRDSIKIYGVILKFTCSSLMSFLVDYSLFSFFLLLVGSAKYGLLAANLGARLLSSLLNFVLNKRYVFQSQGDAISESVKYFALVLFNISINSLFLTAITDCGLNAYIGKLLVEIFMFFISYTVQRRLIFRNGRKVETC